jgi:hypothetical protein
MADTHKKARYRRVAILTLLLVLIATALGTEIFPNKGHAPSRDGTAAAGAGGGMVGGTALALLPLDRGVLHPDARHKTARLHTASGDADSDEILDSGFEGGDGLQNLVYRGPAGDDNKPQSDGGGDGDHGWGFGGGGGAPGFGGGGGAPGFGGGGSDPLGFGGPNSGPNSGPGDGPGDGPGSFPISTDTPPNPGGDPPPYGPPNLPAITQAFSPVPEPATWTMLILGFGAVGFALRRARRLADNAALTPPPGPSLA